MLSSLLFYNFLVTTLQNRTQLIRSLPLNIGQRFDVMTSTTMLPVTNPAWPLLHGLSQVVNVPMVTSDFWLLSILSACSITSERTWRDGENPEIRYHYRKLSSEVKPRSTRHDLNEELHDGWHHQISILPDKEPEVSGLFESNFRITWPLIVRGNFEFDPMFMNVFDKWKTKVAQMMSSLLVTKHSQSNCKHQSTRATNIHDHLKMIFDWVSRCERWLLELRTSVISDSQV